MSSMHEPPDLELRALLAFQERYWRDRQQRGRAQPLGHYLALAPGFTEAIAREYLALQQEPGSDSPRGTSARAGLPEEGKASLGPYRLLRILGRGGQGTVYLAEDARLHRLVALKVLTGLAAVSERLLERFRREAETASRLDHPGICTVYEAGQADGAPYIAMRYVEGVTLAETFAGKYASPAAGDTPRETKAGLPVVPEKPGQSAQPSSRPPSRRDVDAIVRLVAKTARTLHAAHQAGVIHRDIKPGNIMVTPAGEPVVLDFGMARDAEGDQVTLTQSGDFFGTPVYMSPEQVSGEMRVLDGRTDIWSLGVTLYEILARHRPFVAVTREGLWAAILRQEPPDLRRMNPAVPRDLAVVVQTALQKDRNRRYQSAQALAEDLEAVLAGRPIAARPISRLERCVRWARQRPAAATLAILLILGLPVGGALAAYVLPRLTQSWKQERELRVEAMLARGFLALAESRLAEARETFQQALAEEEGRTEMVAGLALTLLEMGSPEQVLSLLDSSRQEDRATLAPLRIVAERRLGRLARAEGEPVPSPEGASSLEHFLAAQALIAGGDRSDPEVSRAALARVEAAVLYSTTPRLLYFATWVQLAGLAGEEEAVRRGEPALAYHWPDSPAALLARGAALHRIGRSLEALPLLKACLRQEPKDALAHSTLGGCLSILGRSEEALREHEEAWRLRPDDIEAGFYFASACLDAGLLDRAQEVASELLARQPRDARLQNLQGMVLVRQRLLPQAEPFFREALRLQPGFAAAHNSLGACLANLGHFDEGVAELREAIRLSPRMAQAYANLGNALAREGRTADAIEPLQAAVKLSPDHALSRYNLGNALMKEERLQEAVLQYQEALKRSPDAPAVHCNLGLALRRLGRPREALDHLRIGHERGSQSPGWKYPSARWVRECEELLKREEQLARYLAGEEKILDGRTLIDLAELAASKKAAVAAAHLYRTAFEVEPSLLEEGEARYLEAAIRVSVRAGIEDPGTETPENIRAVWRAQGLSWLHQELARQEQMAAAGGPREAARAAAICRRWTQDPLLARLQEGGFPDTLGPEERAAWISFWKEVTHLLDSWE